MKKLISLIVLLTLLVSVTAAFAQERGTRGDTGSTPTETRPDRAPTEPTPVPAATTFSEDELDLICGEDWILTWEEDSDGNPVAGGTVWLYCGGEEIEFMN